MILAILACLSVSFAFAEDFTTVTGKIYKEATISRVEADGIVIKTKTGISKVYFVELPANVRERFRPAAPTPSVTRREPEPIKQPPKQGDSRQGVFAWAGALPLSASSLKLLILGALLITSLVVVIVRRRLSRQQLE